MHNFPKQRLSYRDKSANDFKWAKEVVDAILTFSPPNDGVVNRYNSAYQRKLSNYQLYNNQINQKDFERECNPLGLDVGQMQDLIHPYNKTYNKIQVLLSDESKRPFTFRSILVNSEGIRSKLAHRDSLLRNYLNSTIQQYLAAIPNLYNQELLEPLQPVLQPAELQNYLKYNYRERREILSQQLLNYLQKALDLKDLKNDAFKHALISGDEIVYVGHRNNHPYVENINPLGFFHHKSSTQKWIHKSLYAGYCCYLTQAEVLDKCGKFLTEKQISEIDTNNIQGNPLREFTMEQNAKYGNTPYDPQYPAGSDAAIGNHTTSNSDDILVCHVEWVSQKRIGFISSLDQEGTPSETMVSEDFVIPENHITETVEGRFGQKTKYYVWQDEQGVHRLYWDFIPEVWTATKIGNSIYTMIGPKDVQFRSVDDPFDVSLGYHGVVYNNTNAESVSLMDRMKPFQYLYFIVMHKLKRLIAQDQGKVFPLDISMIDSKLGLEKTLYYLKEMNIDVYNPLMNGDEPGQSQRGKVTSAIDMSNMQFIMNYINLLASIDAQISDVAGVSRQREGQTAPTEAVTNAQSNLQMSALITEIYFQLHNKLWEKILTSLVHVTKEAWKGQSVVKQYMLDDLSLETLELTADDLSDVEVGVFITDSGKEHEMFQALKSISDGLLNTNRATFSDLISLYEASSSSELKNLIRTSEQEAQNREVQAQQAEIEAAQQAQAAQQEFELEKQARDHAHKERLAQIEVFKFQQDIDIDNNGIPDPLEVEKFLSDQKLKSRKLDLEEKKMKQDAEIKEKELKIKARKTTSK